MGLVSDGGVHSGWAHIEALIELAAQEGVPDLVVHAFTDGRDTLPTVGAGLHRRARALAAPRGPHRHRRRALLRDGPRPALGAHQARLRRDRPRRGLARRRPPTAAIAAARERDETDEFIKPTVIGDYDGMADGDVVDPLQLPPRPRPRAHQGARRARTSTSSIAATPPEIELTTLTEYHEGWPYPVAFPPRAPETTLAEVLAERGRAPAARRRDREVRPRHLLLQRRPRGGVGGGGARAGRLAARRPHLRPQAGDERRRGGRGVRRAAGARATTASGSSTSPTPTWSATPATSPPRSPRSRPSTAASARSSRRSTRAGGACLITADHGNAEQMLEPDGSPNTAHSLNPVPFIVTVVGDRRSATAASSPTSRRRRSRCSGSSSRRR